MTYLGSSTLSDEVLDAMKAGAKSYYDMTDLHSKAYEYIAKRAGAQGAYITPGASSGIIAATAALITRGNRTLIESVPNVDVKKKTFVLQKGHSIHFGAKLSQMIELGGGVVKEVGTANKCLPHHLSDVIDETVCGIYYVKSHHAVQDGMVSLEDTIKIAKENNVPVIVDAAAEEDLQKYLKAGADLVIYSGAKAFSGPTSGCIVGNNPYIEWCTLQSIGVMRAMKVGKETILGLISAIENQDQSTKTVEQQEEILLPLFNYFSQRQGCETSLVKDNVGRSIVRLRVKINSEFPLNAQGLSKWLKEQKPAIYTRDHHAENGYIEFDPRPMKRADSEIIISKLEQLLK